MKEKPTWLVAFLTLMTLNVGLEWYRKVIKHSSPSMAFQAIPVSGYGADISTGPVKWNFWKVYIGEKLKIERTGDIYFDGILIGNDPTMKDWFVNEDRKLKGSIK